MTVAELIAKLQTFDQDALVLVTDDCRLFEAEVAFERKDGNGGVVIS